MLSSQPESPLPPDAWEARVEEFEDAWQSGTPPCLPDFLDELDDAFLVSECLVELVAIDQEHRWRCAGGAVLPEGLTATPLLEEYVASVPQLAGLELPLDLIVSEYRARRLSGSDPRHDEYSERFGSRFPELTTALVAEDQRLGREGTAPRGIEVGTQLGPYQITGLLGVGGMGEVYRARDDRLGRDVAIKVLPPLFAGDPERLSRFQREARAVASVSHPNIVVLYDIGEDHGIPYVVTELVAGQTLRERLQESALPLDEAVRVGVELADALVAAHRAGVIHRDLKPANIMFTADGRPRVLDFGLARQSETAAAGHTDPATQPGSVLGTPGYMSPEQLRGQPVDHRSDLFSLGCVLFEMCVGRGPFHRDTAADMSAAVLSSETPRFLVPGAPACRPLQELVQRCLARDRTFRPRDAAEVRDALRSIQQELALAESAGDEPVVVSLPATGRSATTPLLESIAVLPLENQTGTPDLDYLADGIPESVIYRLSRFENLRVMAWSSVTRHREETDPRQLGALLDVSSVLLGRLLQRGPQLLVRLELVNTTDGTLIWSEQFQRDAARAFDLESDISRQVGEKLRLRLTSGTRPSVAPGNLAAYQEYLKGRYHWNRRNAANLELAISHFERAIAEDSGYARAYAGLADAHGLLIAWGRVRPRESFPLARQMAVQALHLDETLAEAHTSLGYISVVYEWDWDQAEEHYRNGIALNPSYATARHWLGYLLMLRRRFGEAEEELRAARSLDPLSPIISANLGLVSLFAGDTEQAMRLCEETLALDEKLPSVHYYLGLIQEQLGDSLQAAASFRAGIELSGGVPGELGSLGHALATAGKHVEAREVLDQLQRLGEENYVTAWNEGLIQLALGEEDTAFTCFERARQERDFYLIYLDVDPRLQPLQTDPRLIDLRDRAGLPRAV